MDDEEKQARLREIKLGNIRLIGDLYLHNAIPIKIISECVDFLFKKIDTLYICTLCELVKKICKKLYFEDLVLLEKILEKLEEIYNSKDKLVDTKTRFKILDIIDLKKLGWGIKDTDQLITKFTTEIRSRKNSEMPTSRKSSINPTNVEYIRRSRFNSRADELKKETTTIIIKDENIMDELVTSLGADIEFYQCFRLTEEEFALIKKSNNELITEYSQEQPNKEEIVLNFNKLVEDLQCEKFIIIGHLLENMFSLNIKNSNITMNVLIYLYQNALISEDDIKHGIVLGLVNFKDNIIDYPNSKEYLQKFLKLITENKVIDENLLKVYQKCCDNMEKY